MQIIDFESTESSIWINVLTWGVVFDAIELLKARQGGETPSRSGGPAQQGVPTSITIKGVALDCGRGFVTLPWVQGS